MKNYPLKINGETALSPLKEEKKEKKQVQVQCRTI